MNMLRIYDVILNVLRKLRPVLRAIEKYDSDLARQGRRAACSIALNVAEGSHSRGRNRQARYHTALGSARETLAVLEVALALEYLSSVDEQLLDQLQRILATLIRLSGRG
jgi:four helix bundle protein